MKTRSFLLGAAAVLFAAPAFAAPETLEIDPAHSSSGFAVKHLVVSTVRGLFGKTTGTVSYDKADPAKSSVEATIDATTIDTRDEKRDAHLKSADFFDVANHPTITFKSTKVEKAGDGKLKVTGNLTIRGTTKPVTLDVEGPSQEIKDPWGNTRIAATATTRINRKDFGVSWNKTLDNGGTVVSEDVTIVLDLEMVKKPAGKSAEAKK
jgi:polyisoprenoid-binding protein YceI